MRIRNYIQIYSRFEKIDREILQHLTKITQNSFVKLWISQKDYTKHLQKRLKHQEIKGRKEYLQKVLQTLCHPDKIYYLKGTAPPMRDKIFFIGDNWVTIFLDDAKMITAFPLKVSLHDLLQDHKNRAYLQIPIPLSFHNPKKVIICQKKESHAVPSSTQV